MGLSVYELADIANVLKIEKSRVKNWTIGRPFSVTPSVRISSGKGSRNLFSLTDLYCFALIKHLLELDAPVAAVQEMLASSLVSEDSFWLRRDWLVITRKGQATSYCVALQNDNPNVVIEPEVKDICIYAVNLKPLADELSLTPDKYIAPGVRSAIAAFSQPSGEVDEPDFDSGIQTRPEVVRRPDETPNTNPVNRVQRSEVASQKNRGSSRRSSST
jgi:hypothetical protein